MVMQNVGLIVLVDYGTELVIDAVDETYPGVLANEKPGRERLMCLPRLIEVKTEPELAK